MTARCVCRSGRRRRRGTMLARWPKRRNTAPAGKRSPMQYRRMGHSGLRVPALSFGTGTFGGGNDFFKAWGSTDAGGASRLIDVCLDHGVSLFDTADVYSSGLAEEILGAAIKGKRDR